MKSRKKSLKHFVSKNHARGSFGVCVVFSIIMLCLSSVFVFAQESGYEEVYDEGVEFESTDKIVLDLKGIEITELFRILSVKTGMTIVPSRDVTGRINIFLNNVSFDDALDIILFTQKLAVEKKDEILYILTEEEYRRLYGRDYIENREYKSIKLQYATPANVFEVLSELKSDIGKIIVDETTGAIIMLDTPDKIEFMTGVVNQLDTALDSYIFDVNYAAMETIQEKLSDVITPNTGQLIVDERSSKVIISDLPSKMDYIKEVLASLDVEDQQVYIEAEIVQITLTDTKKRGIDWDAVFTSSTDDLHLYSDYSILGSADASFGKATVGTVERDKYTAVFEYMKTYGDVKILSRPRITVLNNEEASVLIGTREAFISGTTSQGDTTVTSESVEFVDVGVKLNVVPTINREGFITLKIKPEVSSVSETLETAASIVPIVATSEAETVVRVKDGVMIMIAGLMKTDKRKEDKGVPGLSAIPLVGNLFSSRDESVTDTELVIFLTPHLITGEEPVRKSDFDLFMPEEMRPPDMKRKMILREIEAIGLTPQEEGLVLEKKMVAEEQDNLLKKLKGLKSY